MSLVPFDTLLARTRPMLRNWWNGVGGVHGLVEFEVLWTCAHGPCNISAIGPGWAMSPLAALQNWTYWGVRGGTGQAWGVRTYSFLRAATNCVHICSDDVSPTYILSLSHGYIFHSPHANSQFLNILHNASPSSDFQDTFSFLLSDFAIMLSSGL